MTVDSRPHDLAGCRYRDGQGCHPDCGCRCHAAVRQVPMPARSVVRLQVQAALIDVGEPFSRAQVNRVANAVMLLLAGAPKYAEVVHACPPGDEGLTPCCRRTPFELPRTDRLTLDPELVTCGARHCSDTDNTLCDRYDPATEEASDG